MGADYNYLFNNQTFEVVRRSVGQNYRVWKGAYKKEGELTPDEKVTAE